MIENNSKLRLAQRSIPAAHPARDEAAPPDSALSRLRLLTVLDALLVTRSVTGAAEALDLSPAAVSRMLAQLRLMFADELMVRAGRGLAPTALAESLRPRLRALVFEADQLMQVRKAPEQPGRNTPPAGTLPPAPQTFTAPPALEGQPDIMQVLAHREQPNPTAPGAARMARYVSIVGAGHGQARSLSRPEAEDAFAVLFDNQAHPVQIGAFVVALQMRGIAAAELSGMVAAARRGLSPLGGASAADLDWPAYISPRNRRPPWFILAARLVADAGYRVMLHAQQADLLPYAAILEPLGIPVAGSVADAEAALPQAGCALLPLPALHPRMAELMQLYRLFDMRSPIGLGKQLLNPLAAPVTMMGLPSASQTTLHREAAQMLGLPHLLTVDSHRDVAQATPHRLMRITLGRGEEARSLVVPPVTALRPDAVPADLGSIDYALGLWAGTVRDASGLATVVDTAAIALIAMGAVPFDMEPARARALALWQARQRHRP